MLHAKSHINRETDSRTAGRRAGASVKAAFGDTPVQCVVVYATLNHDQEGLLAGIRDELGDGVDLLGCSAQGVMGPGEVWEEGFAVGVLGLGGSDIHVAAISAREIATDTLAKGEHMGRALAEKLGGPAKAAVLLYDPLAGADAEALVGGLRGVLGCQLSGGAASQPWGAMTRTVQYFGEDVFAHGAVALAIGGNVEAIVDSSTGVSPAGLTMTVTKTDGHRLLELDGRRAIDVWREITGSADTSDMDSVASWAIGMHIPGKSGELETIIRAAFGFDEESGAVILQAPIPEGREIMFQHRTVSAVLDGTTKMADRLRGRSAAPVRAVLGFECGARTKPFLGLDETRRENQQLQQALAPAAEWLGLMAWGEIVDVGQSAQLCNYTFPVLLLSDAA